MDYTIGVILGAGLVQTVGILVLLKSMDSRIGEAVRVIGQLGERVAHIEGLLVLDRDGSPRRY